MKNVKWKKISLSLAILIGIGVTCKLFCFSVDNSNEQNNNANYREHVAENYKIYSLATPEKLSFAGEDVPLNDVDIIERLDKEITINTYWHSSTLFLIKRANRWFPAIEKILKEEGVPDDFKYLAAIESNFDHVVSPAGASGYWQFLKSTGQSYGLEINNAVDERYHVEKATRAACKYLKNAYATLHNWTNVAASYNMGIAGIQSKLKEQNCSNYFDLFLNSETHRYVFRILAIKEILTHPTYYGFNVRPQDLYVPYETIKVQIDSTIPDLITFAKSQNTNYKILKLLNPWLRNGSLPNSSKKTYELLLPKPGFNLKPIVP